jgi:cytoskeletal protein CcmA (bactofilin family)
MATYVNNLRLTELATGEGSGTWGTTTNTNLELIGQALGFGTRAIANASTDNITIADGVSDADRAMYLKLTGGGQACTVTILPNTASKVWWMENATSYTLTFTCGSGANVAVLAGETKCISTDGLGSGGAVYDVLTDVNLAGTTKVDDLVVGDALTVGGTLGVTGVLTTTAATVFNGGFASNADSTLGTDKKVQFRDAAIYINSSVDGQLDIVADTEIQIAATTIDINGAINASGEIIAASLDISGNVDVDGITNLDVVDIDGAVQIDAALTVGVDDTGYDVKFYGATGGAYMLWDESADDLILAGAGGLVVAGNVDFNGDLDVDGTTNLDVVDIDGAVDMASTLAVTGAITGATAAFTQTNTANSPVSARYDGSNKKVAFNINNSNGQGFIASNSNSVGSSGNQTYDITNTAGKIDFGSGITIDTAVSGSAGGTITYVNNAEFLPTGIIFNEGGVDADFRVESDGNANMLFVDGGNSHVGMGTATLNRSGLGADHIVLTVGADTEMGMLELQGTRTSDADLGRVSFLNAGTRRAEIVAARIDADNSTKLYFQTSNAGSLGTRLTIGKDGAATFNSGATFGAAINVGGTITGDDGLIIDGGAGNAYLSVGSNTGSWAWKNYQASHKLALEDSDGTGEVLNFSTSGAVTFTPAAGGHAVFNEDGADADFRVESDADANGLFLDAGNGHVALGSGSYSSSLNINAEQAFTRNLGADNSATLLVGKRHTANNTNAFGVAGTTHDTYYPATFVIDSAYASNVTTYDLTAYGVDYAGWSGAMNFKISNGATATYNMLGISSVGGVVINEESTSLDFRVESDTNANGLMLDASTSTVGVNRAASAGVGLSVNATATNSSTYALEACNSSSNTKFIVRSDGYIGFYKTGNAAGLIHNTDGAITITPDAGGHFVFNEDGADADFRVESDTNANMFVVDASTDRVGVGVAAPLETLHVAGSVFSSSGYYITVLQGNAQLTNASTSSGSNASYIGQGLITVVVSDAKAKENFGAVEENECLNKIVSLSDHVKKFDWIDEDWKREKGRTVGMVAQEVYEDHSEFVHKPENYNDDGWAIRYQEIVPTLIKAFQEQQELIKTLEARITALES